MPDILQIRHRFYRILLVEDSVSDAVLLKKSLAKIFAERISVKHVLTLQEALNALGETEYDVALLDLSLPDTAEFEGLFSIQNIAPKLPVIMLTAYADEELALKAVEQGAQDYLFKDRVSGESVLRAMQYAVQRKQFESVLITQANFDGLTGLANRTLFESRVDMALARLRRNDSGLGIFFVDLDHFKQINDKWGHAAGDKVLQQAAGKIKSCLRPYDTAARFGGDEFALLIEGIISPRDCVIVARKVIDSVSQPYQLTGQKMEVGASIGIATCFTGERIDRDELMRQADAAMYDAKLSSRGTHCFFTPEIHAQAHARMQLEKELQQALARDQLTLHYQPKINLRSGQTTGVEALVRWNHPDRGLLLPGEFIAIAEEIGLAVEIGHWVLKKVCDDIKHWLQSGLPLIQVSVNMFISQIDERAFPDMLRGMLKDFGVDPSLIALEIPSIALLERMEERVESLRKIRGQGVAIHLDHFGASAISLASLDTSCISAVKIAPELTQAVDQSSALPLQQQLQAILNLARHFEVGVIGAGIESEGQKEFYRENNCREGQGMAVCRPFSEDSLPAWLNAN